MPGPNSWDSKGNCLPEKLADLDWAKEYWSCGHPVRIQIGQSTMYNYDTGEVICQLPDDYNFYLAHGHIHLCKADWDRKTYPSEWPLEPIGEQNGTNGDTG